MTRFAIHTLQTAKEKSKKLLEPLVNDEGNISNLLGILAEAPIALEAYLKLNELFLQSSFTRQEQQLILLMISRENQCEYCINTHLQEAKLTHIEEDILQSLTCGMPLKNPRLNALRIFIQEIVRKRRINSESVEKFMAHGYTHQHILEILTATALKTLSNFTNNMVKTPIESLQHKEKVMY